MSGLREKQKAQRRELIEAAATSLFEERSFVSTTIEEIAERAVVSPATVYNYYGSKGELLLALVARGEEGIVRKQEQFIDLAQSKMPALLVTEIIMSNIDDTLKYLSRELWGHAVAYVSTTKDATVAPRYLEMIADNLASTIEKTLEKFVMAGKLPKTLDLNHLSYLLTRLERIHFLNFIYLKAHSRDDLEAAIASDVAFLTANLGQP